jgi:cohesin complex subunit SA-1/2
MKTLPDVYLEGAYFKYVGWMLDDVVSFSSSQSIEMRFWMTYAALHLLQSAPTRLQTVRALSPLYQNDSNAGGLSSFTERFKKRILQMAFHDTDLSVRTTAISILNYIDRSGMLDDEKRRQVGLLIFDAEFRVRKAVAGFFEGRWKEETEEMLEEMEGVGRKGKKGGQKGGDVDEETIKERVSWKCLASMLIRFTRALDDAREGEEDARLPDQAARETAEQLKAWHDMTTKGRVASAVESLWEKVEGLRDWEGLVKFLGLDHSGESEDGEGGGDEAWKVDEEEEASLIQVLVAGLRKARAEGDKKVRLS